MDPDSLKGIREELRIQDLPSAVGSILHRNWWQDVAAAGSPGAMVSGPLSRDDKPVPSSPAARLPTLPVFPPAHLCSPSSRYPACPWAGLSIHHNYPLLRSTNNLLMFLLPDWALWSFPPFLAAYGDNNLEERKEVQSSWADRQGLSIAIPPQNRLAGGYAPRSGNSGFS